MGILVFNFLSLSEEQKKSLPQTKSKFSRLSLLVPKDTFALPVFISLPLLTVGDEGGAGFAELGPVVTNHKGVLLRDVYPPTCF